MQAVLQLHRLRLFLQLRKIYSTHQQLPFANAGTASTVSAAASVLP